MVEQLHFQPEDEIRITEFQRDLTSTLASEEPDIQRLSTILHDTFLILYGQYVSEEKREESKSKIYTPEFLGRFQRGTLSTEEFLLQMSREIILLYENMSYHMEFFKKAGANYYAHSVINILGYSAPLDSFTNFYKNETWMRPDHPQRYFQHKI